MNDYSEEILRKLRNLKPQFPEMHIKRLRVFGSVVRGEAKPGSDVDLLVDFENGLTLFDVIDVQDRLENHLKVSIDLVTPPALHTALKDRILKEAQDV